jgi:hypothetical protein
MKNQRFNQIAAVLLGSVAISLPAIAADPASGRAAPEKPWDVSLETDFRYVHWRSNRGTPSRFDLGSPGRGDQVYHPISAKFVWRPTADFRVDVLVRGGWAWGRQNSGGGLSGSVTSLTDTSLTGRVTYTGLGWVMPFAGVSVNLPTGDSVLSGRSAFARMDPDLVEIANYGSGTAVGPTLGALFVLGPSTSLGVAVGHTFTSSYTRDSVAGFGLPNTRYSPADVTSYGVEFKHRYASWTFGAGALLVTSGNVKFDGVTASRAGASITLTGSAAYDWNAAHRTTGTVSWGQSSRNMRLDPFNALVREPFNSNSSTIRLGLAHDWKLNEQWTVGAHGSWFRRDNNAYLVTDLQYAPAKTKITLGGSAKYRINERFTLNARAEHFWLRQHATPDWVVPGFGVIAGSAVPRVRATGYLIAIGGSANF